MTPDTRKPTLSLCPPPPSQAPREQTGGASIGGSSLRLVIAAVARAPSGGGITSAGGPAPSIGYGLIHQTATADVLRAATQATSLDPEDLDEECRLPVVLEEEVAPPLQASGAGKDPFVGVVGSQRDRAIHTAPPVIINLNATSGSCNGGRPSIEMQRKQARPSSTTTMSSPRVLFGEMPTPTATVEDPFYGQLMENVIFEVCSEALQTGGQGWTFDLEETQSQHGCDEYMADEDFEADHGDSWHEEHDIYCEGDGEEEDGVEIAGEPLFVDELT
ncbi:Formin-like protein 15 [Hordeum vulgare]|nr:Formin-like protein 15 [Hordeum vulgare]